MKSINVCINDNKSSANLYQSGLRNFLCQRVVQTKIREDNICHLVPDVVKSILVICQELFEKDFDVFFGKKGNFNRPSVKS